MDISGSEGRGVSDGGKVKRGNIKRGNPEYRDLPGSNKRKVT